MHKKYLFYSPAKINLNLHILATRKDGYHELETDIIPIELWDRFTLFPATEKKMQKNYNLSNKEDLTCKAIQLLEQNTKKSLTYHLKDRKIFHLWVAGKRVNLSHNSMGIISVTNS